MPVRLDADLHRRLLELARSGGASLFMVLQAGLAALLCRLGAGEDIPIGSPIAGRGEPALEDLVGFFVNTLVLRTDVSGNPSFRELLGRVRAFDLEAYDHQDVPFEQVVEALQPARSLARHPLFQVMLMLQNTPGTERRCPGLTARPQPLMSDVAKFDLTLALGELRAPEGSRWGSRGAWSTAGTCSTREPPKPLGRGWCGCWNRRWSRPTCRCTGWRSSAPASGTLWWRRSTPRRRRARGDAAAAVRGPGGATPDAVALVFEGQELSYGELNARANRLAHHLIGLGVGPEALVGVCLDARSRWWWGFWPSSRRAAPTCRWTRSIPRLDWHRC